MGKDDVAAVVWVKSHGLLENGMKDGGYSQPRTTFPASVQVKFKGPKGDIEFTADVVLPLGSGAEIRAALVEAVRRELVSRGLETAEGKVIIV